MKLAKKKKGKVMNTFSGVGNLGADPQTKEVGSTAVTTFPVAFSFGYGKNKGTLWTRCDFWGKRGEVIATYFNKGSKIWVEGELQMDTWTGKDGEEHSKLKLNCDKFGFVDGGSGNSKPVAPPSQDQVDDDIPF